MTKKYEYDFYVAIYGIKTQSSAIAKLLDSSDLFLQQPHTQDLLAPYSNPHYLCNPMAIQQVADNKSQMATVSTTNKSADKASTPLGKLEEQHPLKKQIQEVVDSAQGPQSFSATVQSPRLRTKLKA